MREGEEPAVTPNLSYGFRVGREERAKITNGMAKKKEKKNVVGHLAALVMVMVF